jgi:tetratricopeptide (TPR) repeat protein
MAENRNNSSKKEAGAPSAQAVENYSLDVTRTSAIDEVESARILFNEGLIDEAKKRLFRVLTQIPKYEPARKLLAQIDEVELKKLFQHQPTHRRAPPTEDIDAVLATLDRDLGLALEHSEDAAPENWHTEVVGGKILSPRELYDLGIAFHQMGFYTDALRELRRAEKKIRIENSFLDSLGISVVALTAEILTLIGRAYEARAYLEPILTEPDLKHEDKLCLYYEMAIAEDSLHEKARAQSWYQKIMSFDPHFRDVAHRVRQK